MVTSTSTAAYNNFSDVAETDGMANFIVNDVSGGGYCGFLFTSKDTNCFLNNFNSSQEEESEHIVGSFVPLPVNNVISEVPVFTLALTLLPVNYLYLEKSLADDGGGTRRLAVFSRKSIPSKTQTGPIEGVITFLKNELYFLSQIAYTAKNLRIFILEAVLLNQKNENNSNWTRFVQPVASPQEQNIEQITKEFVYTYECLTFVSCACLHFARFDVI
ncbi:PR domain zinc finger protein 10 [Tyrophagus putrescentiae]|nr:PR domain zinc finger protein 10 [Tyrophagus putrescentiae]